MLRGIIFDMNGVIVDDERIHQESWKQLCQKYGFQLSEDEFKYKVFGHTEADTFTYLFKQQFTLKELDKLSAERVEIVINIIKPKLAFVDGLLHLLQDLRAHKVPIAIATNSRRPYTNFIIDNLKIREFFKFIVTAEEIDKGKPDPEIYLRAAKGLSIDPKNCIAIEDSLSGIKSAQAAGMKVIAISTTHTTEELGMADEIINSFDDISFEKLDSRML
jgi:beta-phosphoglucomutase family hydrolase